MNNPIPLLSLCKRLTIILVIALVSVLPVFSGISSISELDSKCVFSFAAFSDNRGYDSSQTRRAYSWGKKHKFVLGVGDIIEKDSSAVRKFLDLWKNDSFYHNNFFPTFGNHCSVYTGSQTHWGTVAKRTIPLLNLRGASGVEFRKPGTQKVKGSKSKSDPGTIVNYDDQYIDYYVKRTYGKFTVHIITVYKQDRAVFFKKSADFLYNKMVNLASKKSNYDIIIVQGHEERWLLRSYKEQYRSLYPKSFTKSQVAFINEHADLVLAASDHRFRRLHEFDSWGKPNGALHVDTGQVMNRSSGNGYMEFHVFDNPPRFTGQYIDCDVSTRKLHSGKAKSSIKTDRGEKTSLLYPMMKKLGGPITQPLSWSSFNVTAGNYTKFVKPTDNASVKQGANLQVTVDASDADGVSRVDLYVDGKKLDRSEGAAPYDFNSSRDPELANLSLGSHTLKATAVDTKGSTRSATITIKIVNPVTLTSPTDDGIYGGAVPMAADAASDIDYVNFWVDDGSGARIEIVENSAPFSRSAYLAVGTYQVWAEAIDLDGKAYTTPKVTITIDQMVTPPPTPPADNLVENPGFEDGAAGWQGFTTPWLPSTVEHSGANAARNKGGSEQNLYQEIAITPNTTYRLTVWMQSDNGSSGRLQVDTTDAFDDQGVGFIHDKHDGKYYEYTGTFNSGSQTSVRIRAFSTDIVGNGRVDDFELLRLDAPPPTPNPNLLANPGFEEGKVEWTGFENKNWLSSSIAKEGSVSARTIGTGILSQEVTLQQNTQYELIAWMRLSAGSTGSIYVDTDDVFDSQGVQFVLDKADNVWYKYEGSFNSGSATKVKIRAFSEGLSGTGRIDSLVVRKK